MLPILLENLRNKGPFKYDGSDMSINVLKIRIIRDVCEMEFDPSLLISVAKMFR